MIMRLMRKYFGYWVFAILLVTLSIGLVSGGMQKYGHEDARPVLERASARETAARVALGELARSYLRQSLSIEIVSHVVAIGHVCAPDGAVPGPGDGARARMEADRGAARRRVGSRRRTDEARYIQQDPVAVLRSDGSLVGVRAVGAIGLLLARHVVDGARVRGSGDRDPSAV